jgi:hypothetical protein
VPAHKPDVQLEQGLAVSLVKLIQQAAPGPIGKGFEERVQVHT